MPQFSSDFLQRLRDAVPVSQVLAKHVQLKRHGRQWKGCCPFHKEKTPSFYVQDDRQSYHCFGCGAHGDHIKFLMEHERLSFTEAVTSLAATAGIALPVETGGDHSPAPTSAQFAEAYRMLNTAERWFHNELMSPRGITARRYVDERGLTEATIQKYQLGFAPAQRYQLRDFLRSEGFSDRLQLEHGLLIQPEDGGEPYSRFRGRLMFPIRNPQGKTIAFGGRILDEGQPKYLNSPETPLFHKRLTLFNLDRARKAAHQKQRLLVVEGYMDAIALAQAGVEEAVAPLGTAITEEHLERLWQISDQPILCLDGDSAGQRAMLRLAELALPSLTAGKTLLFSKIPAGDDPDSIIQNHGINALETILNHATPLSRALLNQRVAELGSPPYPPESFAKLGQELRQLAGRVQNAEMRHLMDEFFKDRLAELKNSQRQKNTHAPSRMQYRTQAGSRQPTITPGSKLRPVRQDQHEKPFFALITQHPSLLGWNQVYDHLSNLELQDASLKQLQRALLDAATRSDLETASPQTWQDYWQSKGVGTLVASLPPNMVADGSNPHTEAERIIRHYHERNEWRERSVFSAIPIKHGA